jgi:hypothetical protein
MMIVGAASQRAIPGRAMRGFITGFLIHAIGANAMRSSPGVTRNDE